MSNGTSSSDSTQGPFDVLSLQGLNFYAVIGILPAERLKTQPITIDLVLHLNLEETASSGDLSLAVDYGKLMEWTLFILRMGHFFLLESAALAVARFILSAFPSVSQAAVHISKPEILCGSAVPQISIVRNRHQGAVYEKNNLIFSCPEVTLEWVEGKDHETSLNAHQTLCRTICVTHAKFLRITSRSAIPIPVP